MSAPRPQVPFRPGDALERELVLTAEDVVRLAAELGDPNPLHHDPVVAARSRFGGLIAAGGHLVGLLTSLCAAFTTARAPSVGLGFSYRLRRAAPAGARITLRWEVTSVSWSEKLGGHVVAMAGRIADGGGRLLVEGTGEVLVRADLG